MVLMAYVDRLGDNRDVVWYIDSGCSNHMCGDSSLFCELEEGFNKVVRLRNYVSMNLSRKGSILLIIKGLNHLVQNVYYVPGLKNNLLSVGHYKKGVNLDVLMQSNECQIYHRTKGLVFQTNMAANQMFVLFSSTKSTKWDGKEECFQAMTEDIEDDAHLWHQRFGHLSYKSVKTLQTKGMVRGLPSFPNGKFVCTNCLKGKQHQDVTQG